jgi:hypothetical protein
MGKLKCGNCIYRKEKVYFRNMKRRSWYCTSDPESWLHFRVGKNALCLHSRHPEIDGGPSGESDGSF